MRLLYLEYDPQIAENIAIVLRNHTFSVDVVSTIDDAYELATEVEYDVLIFDRKIGNQDSAQLIAKLRNEDIGIPILLLTALSQKLEVIAGLNLGADDYLAKPFDSEELLARIRALTRRSRQQPALPILIIGDLQIDTNRHVVTRGGCEIELSPREYSILEYLGQNQGKAVERLDLLAHAWDSSVDIFSNTLDVHIAYLRKKIDVGHQNRLIKTVKGKGYMLCAS